MDSPGVLFRPAKKRKFLRRRLDQTPSELEFTETDSGRDLAPAVSPQDTPEAAPALDAARLRRLHRARKGGIEFSTTSRPSADNKNQVAAPMVTAEELENEHALDKFDRFTAHTGQTVDVNKQMMEYIESEMAKRSRRDIQTDTPDSVVHGLNEAKNSSSMPDVPQREPASIGKLHEIDLGQETKLQNIARTEAATRRLVGDTDHVPQAQDKDGHSKAIPTGKDGRPWRNRKRRTGEDIERDRLVEEILQESKLDVYDGPEEEEMAPDDQAADDKVAEQFRRDFLDAIQSRRRVARSKNTKTTKPEAPKGPKLGGSRSARAAMREMQEKSTRK